LYPATQIWDLAKKGICTVLRGHQQEIYSLEFSADGSFIVSGSGDKSARIWDAVTGTCIFDLRIEDFLPGDAGPLDAGITSVAREFRYACTIEAIATDFLPLQSVS
jgi:glucose repression regulatory protein TUP1